LTIRVIDYRIDDGRHNEETYRLFTTESGQLILPVGGHGNPR